MNFIIDPINLTKFPTNSTEGKNLLKQYILYYQYGGSRKLNLSKIREKIKNKNTLKIGRLGISAKSKQASKKLPNAFKYSMQLPKSEQSSTQLSRHIPPNITACGERICDNRNLICKTNNRGVEGIRKCGVLIKSDLPKKNNEQDGLPISAVFYRDSKNPKLRDDIAILHVNPKIEKMQKMSMPGAYGTILSFINSETNKEEIIKIFKINQEDIWAMENYYNKNGTMSVNLEDSNKMSIENHANFEQPRILPDRSIIARYNLMELQINTDDSNILNELQIKNNGLMKRDFSIINEFNNNNNRFEVDLAKMHKTNLYYYLFEPLILHELSNINVGEEENNTLRTLAPKIGEIYLYMNSVEEDDNLNYYCVAYTMEVAYGSFDRVLTDIYNKKEYSKDPDENHIMNTFHQQIYDLLSAQYEMGYINLDSKIGNLLVNQDYNIQIIDLGCKDYTHEVSDLLKDVDEKVKREIIIFGQELMIMLSIKKLMLEFSINENKNYNDILSGIFGNKFYSNISAKKLKKLSVSPEHVAKYLVSIKSDEKLYTYAFMLFNIGHPNSWIDDVKKYNNYVKDVTKKFFKGDL